ncbi:MAG TPA: FG-GAP-like repeat-containing protein [Gaiellaceae bacterium]|nr:FG-GAP-like repeat-containing protein [Gaiellaceae bacterium]
MRLRRTATFAAQAGMASLVLVGAAGAADPSFAPGGGLPVGQNPVSFAIADVNGDGNRDLAVANEGSDDVTILLGDGTGGFAAASGSPLDAGDGPDALGAADVNRDGRADLVAANHRTNSLTVLLGDGAGGFGVGSPVSVGGSPEDVAAADLNGDGNVDLAVSVWQTNWRVAILIGDGAGRFSPAPGTPFAVGGRYGTTKLEIADLNRDGNRDLVVARSEERMLSIRLGDGAGRFGAATSVAAGYGPSAVAVADLNRDGRLDLAVGSLFSDRGRSQSKLTIMLGNGSGGFRRAAGSPIAVPGMPQSVAAADLNADSRLDIAVANNFAEHDSVTVHIGNGTGRFRPALDSPFAVPSPTQIEVAELNGDGRPDFALAGTEGFRVLFRTPSAPAIARGRLLRGRPNVVFTTSGLITKLAADASRVAVKTTVKSSRSCGRIVVWTAPGRKSKSFSTSNPGCGSILCRPGTGCVDELALGDGQVAWISRSGGNDLELMVITARLSGGAPKRIEHAFNGAGAGGDPKGEWVGGLLGGGSLLAYNGWRVICEVPDVSACDLGEARLRVTNERIVRIAGGRRVVVRRGAGSRPLRAVGGGRAAVESDGVVTVLSARGERVATIPAVPANPPRGIALSRTRLAVLRTFTLDLFDPATGTAVKSIPLGPAASLQLGGVNSTLVLLRGPRRVVLLRLRDGKLISLPITSSLASSIVDARLSETGLFYAYNVRRPSPGGRIVFQPSARLLARF